MDKKRIAYLFLAFTILLAPLGKNVYGRMLYDNFSGLHVDDQRWTGQFTIYNELVREVDSGKLVLKIGNNPNRLIARNHLRFQNELTVHTIQSDIIINQTTLDSGDTPESFVRVNGRFYNTRESGSAGDIWAGVHVGNRGNGLEAWWEVTEILDDSGSSFREWGSGTLPVTELSTGVSYTVKLSYDGANGFNFTVAGVSATFNSGPERKRPPVNTFKGLTAGAYGFSGASGMGYVSAMFDDVYINNQVAVYDTFDTELQKSLWASSESVMEVKNGRLRLDQQGFDQQSQVTTHMSDSDAAYVEAKIRIGSASILSPGASGIIRIQGYFYNETRGEGSGLEYNGFEGDVFANIRLQLHDDGTMAAAASVGRSDSANESEWSDLAWHDFSSPISLDTDYTLSIQYANNQLIFKIDNETYVYPITTSQYPPYGEHRALRTRVYLDTGEYGYVKALVDYVYVDGCNLLMILPAIISAGQR